MNVTETKLKGCFILDPDIYRDDRGYFFESYNREKLEVELGYSPVFIQDNQSRSVLGVVRGLHMQTGEYSQAKLVRVLEGAVLDIAVDVRPDSVTYGQYISVELSAENRKQLFIPRGFLHGFSVITEMATFFYKCDNVYKKESEAGVNPMDLHLDIDWQLPGDKIILSEKDSVAQSFETFTKKVFASLNF